MNNINSIATANKTNLTNQEERPLSSLPNVLVNLVLDYLIRRDHILLSQLDQGKPLVENYQIQQIQMIPAWLRAMQVPEMCINSLRRQSENEIQIRLIQHLQIRNQPTERIGRPAIYHSIDTLIEGDRNPLSALLIYQALSAGYLKYAAQLVDEIPKNCGVNYNIWRKIFSSLIMLYNLSTALEFLNLLESQDRKRSYCKELIHYLAVIGEILKAEKLCEIYEIGYEFIAQYHVQKGNPARALEIANGLTDQRTRYTILERLLPIYISQRDEQTTTEIYNYIRDSNSETEKKMAKFLISLGKMDKAMKLPRIFLFFSFSEYVKTILENGGLTEIYNLLRLDIDIQIKGPIMCEIAIYLASQDSPNEAISILSPIDRSLSSYITYSEIVRVFLKKKNLTKAIEFINQIPSEDTKHVCYAIVIHYYIEEGYLDQAVAFVENLQPTLSHERMKSYYSKIYCSLVKVFLKEGRHTECPRFIQRIVTAEEIETALASIALYLFGEGKIEECFQYVSSIEDSRQKNNVLNALTNYFIDIENLPFIQRSINLIHMRRRGKLIGKLCQLLLKLGHSEVAYKLLIQYSLTLELGQFYLSQNNLPEALKCFEYLRRHYPREQTTFLFCSELVDYYIRQGNITEALQLAKSIEPEPSAKELVKVLPHLETEQALEVANQIDALEGPNKAFALIGLSQNDLKSVLYLIGGSYQLDEFIPVLLKNNRLDKVLELASLVEGKTAKLIIFFHLAKYYASLGDIQKALEAFTQCTEEPFDYGSMIPETLTKIIEACVTQGRVDQALTFVDRLTQINFRIDALEKILKLIIQQGNLVRALELAISSGQNELLERVFNYLILQGHYQQALTLMNHIRVHECSSLSFFANLGRLRAFQQRAPEQPARPPATVPAPSAEAPQSNPSVLQASNESTSPPTNTPISTDTSTPPVQPPTKAEPVLVQSQAPNASPNLSVSTPTLSSKGPRITFLNKLSQLAHRISAHILKLFKKFFNLLIIRANKIFTRRCLKAIK